MFYNWSMVNFTLENLLIPRRHWKNTAKVSAHNGPKYINRFGFIKLFRLNNRKIDSTSHSSIPRGCYPCLTPCERCGQYPLGPEDEDWSMRSESTFACQEETDKVFGKHF